MAINRTEQNNIYRLRTIFLVTWLIMAKETDCYRLHSPTQYDKQQFMNDEAIAQHTHTPLHVYVKPISFQPVNKVSTVKPVFSGHSKRRPKLVFKTDYRLMQVKSIAECSPWSILQYFLPSLSYHLSFRFLFCLFLSCRLRQALLYWCPWHVTITNSLYRKEEAFKPDTHIQTIIQLM